jgi:hypothetical protein
MMNGSLQYVHTIESEVRNILCKHGFKNTFETFQKIMKEDYDFLSNHYSTHKTLLTLAPKETKKVNENSVGEIFSQEVKALVKPSVPTEKKEEPAVQKPVQLAKAIIKVKKVEEKEREQPINPETKKPEIQVEEETEVKNIRIHEFLEGEEPRQADPSSAPGIPPMPPKGLTVKEIKQWQKGEEDKKRDELREKGIDPQTLLTKDNLKQWIEKENKSYAVVARYHVGLPEMYVSEVAKKFGVQSALAKKRRAQIMAARGGR